MACTAYFWTVSEDEKNICETLPRFTNKWQIILPICSFSSKTLISRIRFQIMLKIFGILKLFKIQIFEEEYIPTQVNDFLNCTFNSKSFISLTKQTEITKASLPFTGYNGSRQERESPHLIIGAMSPPRHIPPPAWGPGNHTSLLQVSLIVTASRENALDVVSGIDMWGPLKGATLL